MKIFYFLEFTIFYFWDLALGAFKIAADVITPKNLSSPGIIRMPLEASTDFEITLLSNLITFSPSSMVIDIDHDRKHLHIHLMFLKNQEESIHDFKENFERRVLRILR